MDQNHEKLNKSRDRSKSLLAIFGEKKIEIRQEQEKFGGKGVDWWVKSVATKLLIPYDEVGTSRLADLHGLTSGGSGGSDEHEEHER